MTSSPLLFSLAHSIPAILTSLLFLKHAKPALLQDLHPSSDLCPAPDAPAIHTSCTFTSFRSLCKCSLNCQALPHQPTDLNRALPNLLSLLSLFYSTDHHLACYVTHLLSLFLSTLECKLYEGRDFTHLVCHCIPS